MTTPTELRPLARDDIDIASREIDDETVYFLGDPVKNEYKQLDELQYEVYVRLDGTRTLEELAAELLELFDLEVSAEELREFIDVLDEMALLDPSTSSGSSDVEPGAGARILRALSKDGVEFSTRAIGREAAAVHLPKDRVERRRRHDESSLIDLALLALKRDDLRGAAAALRSALELNKSNWRARYLLHAVTSEHVGAKRDFESAWRWRIPIVDPDRVLGRIDYLIGSLIYSRAFFVAWGLAMATCVVLLALDVDRLIADFHYAFSFRWVTKHPQVVPILWAAGTLSIAMHEGAHGLTCRHYGGRVREMGILFLYLSPGAYCDISSSYLIADRRQRTLISLAGVLCQLTLWMPAVLLYSVVRTDTALGFIAFVLVFQVPGYLAAWNPIIHSDGYLALTDILDYPNFRDDAFMYVRLRAAQLLLGESIEIPPDLIARRRLFLWYAIPGVFGTALFIAGGWILITSALVNQLHTVGLVLSVVFTWLLVGKLAVTVVGALWRSRRRLWASRRVRLVTGIPVAVALMVLATPFTLYVDGRCETRPELEVVRSPFASAVQRVLVSDGQRVRAGEPLVELVQEPLKVALTRSRAELEIAGLDLKRLQARARDVELGVARARVVGERAAFNASGRTLRRLQRLAGDKLVSSKLLEDLRAARASAQTRLSTASRDLQALSAEALAAEVNAATAVLKMLRAQVEADERRLRDATLLAPADGVVQLAHPERGTTLLGRVVGAGDELLRVRRLGGEKLEVLIPITEPIGLLDTGARVRARLRGLPHDAINGELEKLGVTVEVEEREGGGAPISFQRGQVRLADETSSLGLPTGLTGNVEIAAGKHPLAWHAYLRLVRLVEIDATALIGSLR